MNIETKRLFIGIPITQEWAEFFSRYEKEQKLSGVHWVTPENLHLTVYFIGDAQVQFLEDIEKIIRRISSTSQPFTLEFDRIINAPPNRTPTMIWGRFKQSDEFDALSERLFQEINPIVPVKNIHSESIPHVTLARSSYPGEKVLRELEGIPPAMKVTSIVLFSSEHTLHGPVYTAMEHYELGQEND